MPTRAKLHKSRRQRSQTSAPRHSAARRGYGRQWRRLRAEVLAGEPLCRLCRKEGAPPTLATEVDHIIPTRGESDPKHYDRDNLQPLCKTHHSRKTIEDTRQGMTR
jgi:5-methylcytosine-specific restriction protein A